MASSNENTIESIINAKQSIRKKLFELKRGIDESNNFLRTHMSPIVAPLEVLVEKKKQKNDEENINLSRHDNTLNDSLISSTNSERPEEYDQIFGIRLDADGKYMMGDKTVIIDVDKETIKVGKLKKCRFTSGLQELLFKSRPRVGYFDRNDLKMYKCFLLHTRCHRNSKGALKANPGFKYKFIVGPLFKQEGQDITKLYDRLLETTQTGEGISSPLVSLTNKTKEYIYFDDPNELIQRLSYLHASKQAGNTGVNNEIISIEEELREIGIIL